MRPEYVVYGVDTDGAPVFYTGRGHLPKDKKHAYRYQTRESAERAAKLLNREPRSTIRFEVMEVAAFE